MAAIYQWFPGQQLIATSTLYPIEVDNGVEFTGMITSSAMRTWSEDEIEAAVVLLSANLVEILIDGPVLEDEIEAAVVLLDAHLVEILIEGPTPEDEIEAAVVLLDAHLIPKLVTTDTEDTGIVFSGTIVSSSMDDI